jgi:hypothetical protein
VDALLELASVLGAIINEIADAPKDSAWVGEWFTRAVADPNVRAKAASTEGQYAIGRIAHRVSVEDAIAAVRALGEPATGGEWLIVSGIFEAHPKARPALLDALVVKERVAIADHDTTRAMNIIFGSLSPYPSMAASDWNDGQDVIETDPIQV